MLIRDKISGIFNTHNTCRIEQNITIKQLPEIRNTNNIFQQFQEFYKTNQYDDDYDDDIESYDFESEDYLWTMLSVVKTLDGHLQEQLRRYDDNICNYIKKEWTFVTK